jgi:TRAP-type C4-dicarboxylate transport system permease small subunit
MSGKSISENPISEKSINENSINENSINENSINENSTSDNRTGRLDRIEQLVERVARVMNWTAGGFVLIMMLLTTVDVILRLLRFPIPGTYEIVGLLGAAFVSFALAHTSLQRGHIAVDFLVRKLSERSRLFLQTATDSLSFGLFVLVCWQSVLYAGRLRQMGEVSLTLQMPLYPFVYGIAAGTAMLCVVLFLRLWRDFLQLSTDCLPAGAGEL